MQELIFHVGPHKTGSTALQRYMYANRQAIIDSGTYLPSPIGPGHSINSWYLVFVGTRSARRLATYHNAIRGRHDATACEELKPRFTEALIAEFHRAAQLGVERVVLSSEEVSFLDRDDWNSFYDWLKQYFKVISLIYYLRNPYDRMISDLQQALKGGTVLSSQILPGIGGQDLSRIASMEPDPHHRQGIRLNIRPYLYEHAKTAAGGTGWNVVIDFCHHSGIPMLEDPVRYSRVNPRMSAQVMSVVNDINKRMPAMLPNNTFNPLRYHMHNAIEAYRWTELDTDFLFTVKDLEFLTPTQDQARADLLAYCLRQEWLHLDYDSVYERAPEAKDAKGSSLDMSHELPQSYYVNLLCHFWTFLRLSELKAAAGD